MAHTAIPATNDAARAGQGLAKKTAALPAGGERRPKRLGRGTTLSVSWCFLASATNAAVSRSPSAPKFTRCQEQDTRKYSSTCAVDRSSHSLKLCRSDPAADDLCNRRNHSIASAE